MAKSRRKIEDVNWVLCIECTECHQILPANTEYYFKWDCALWLRSKCKECVMRKYADKSLEYRTINRDKINKQKREAHKRNREVISENGQKKKEQMKIYRTKYYEEHYEEILRKRRDYRRESWKGKIRTKTERLINKLWIRPDECSICGWKCKTQAHHPDHNKRNEIIFVCQRCHSRLDSWWFECPQEKIIDLLSFNS